MATKPYCLTGQQLGDHISIIPRRLTVELTKLIICNVENKLDKGKLKNLVIKEGHLYFVWNNRYRC